jgi:hypothetical protein
MAAAAISDARLFSLFTCSQNSHGIGNELTVPGGLVRDVDKTPKPTEPPSALKFLSAIILLMWAACYGRCLAEQTGFLKSPAPAWHCEGGCCEESDGDQPPPEPKPPCKLCDFIKAGGAPTGEPLMLDAPVLVPLPVLVMDFITVLVPMHDVDEEAPVAQNTGPPPHPRMCEWMARTATPVRGPNAGA